MKINARSSPIRDHTSSRRGLSLSQTSQNIPATSDTVQSTRHPLHRWLWYSVAGFLVFDGLAMLDYLLFPPNTINNLKIIGDINNTLGWLVAIIFCITRLPRSWWKKETRATLTTPLQIAQQKLPIWIAGVFFINAIERGAYMYYDMLHVAPLLDWPSIVLLLRYPFLLLAVVSLYRRSLSSLARLRLALDGFIILTALLTFSWYFLVGPIIPKIHQNIPEVLVVIGYPLADLILCFYLFQLSFRNSEPAFRFIRRLFSWGLLGIVVADLCDVSQFRQANSVLSLLQGLILCLGYILITLSVQALRNINAQQYMYTNKVQQEEEVASHNYALSPFLWQHLLPSACVPVVLFFIAFIRSKRSTDYLAVGVFLAGLALILQLVLRQVLVIYETFIANRALQSVQKELYKKNLALTQANHQLEEQAQQLELAYEQQNQANKLKDQFLLNVNHELRTPLTELHGYLELLQLSQGSIDVQARERFLAHALNGSNELQRLVNTILDALRSEHARETLHSEEIGVTSIVQEVIDLFDPRKREAYGLDLRIAEGLTVYADRQYLRQILTNLLSNAFKYAPRQTPIIIGAQMVSASTDEPSSVRMWIQDYGFGIPPKDVASLFDKFFRLAQHQNSSIHGTGLGLYICRQLVEAMNGQIWVESSGIVGEGSCFIFTLPTKHL